MLSSDQISTKQAVLDAHGQDESYHAAMAPQLVAYPETTNQVWDRRRDRRVMPRRTGVGDFETLSSNTHPCHPIRRRDLSGGSHRSLTWWHLFGSDENEQNLGGVFVQHTVLQSVPTVISVGGRGFLLPSRSWHDTKITEHTAEKHRSLSPVSWLVTSLPG